MNTGLCRVEGEDC